MQIICTVCRQYFTIFCKQYCTRQIKWKVYPTYIQLSPTYQRIVEYCLQVCFIFLPIYFLCFSIHRANHMSTILVCNVKFAVCIANVLFSLQTCSLQYCLQLCFKPKEKYKPKYEPDLLNNSKGAAFLYYVHWSKLWSYGIKWNIQFNYHSS